VSIILINPLEHVTFFLGPLIERTELNTWHGHSMGSSSWEKKGEDGEKKGDSIKKYI
jgi:hypothetical protein